MYNSLSKNYILIFRFLFSIYIVISIFGKNQFIMNSYFTAAYSNFKLVFILFILLVGVSNYVFTQSENKNDILENSLASSVGIQKVEILDKLSKEYLKSNTKKSLEYAQEMLALSDKLQNNFQLQKAYLNCARSYYYLSELDSVINYADYTIQMQNQTKNDTVTATGYMLICNVNIIRGNYDIALINGEKALDTYKKIKDTLEIATAQKNISYIFKSRGEYDDAMEYAMAALKTFEQSGDSMRIASALGTIANIYQSTGNLISAKEYFRKAQNHLKSHQNTLIYSQVLMSIAGIYREEGQNDSSLALFHQALLIANKMDNMLLAGKIEMNTANTLKSDNKANQALEAYKRSLAIFKDINSQKDINHVMYSLGETFLQTHNYDSSEYYLLKSLDVSKQLNHALIYEGSLKQLYLLYNEKRSFEDALFYYRSYTQYHDSITGENVQLKIAELETKYETAKKEQQILELEHQQKIEKSEKETQRIIFAGIIFVLAMIVFGIMQKRKKDKQIHRQKEIVHRKEKELAEAELEKSKIKEEELQQSILYKSKQLSTHALHMMQKNTMLQEIQLDIKAMSKKAIDNDKVEYRKIVRQINQSLRSHKDWDVFKLYFEDVNKNFYQKINEINPDLTTNDHRLCALIKLNMTSKEMASVLNVAPNSIKSSRYRLKKKLGLNVEADLEEFIREL